MARSIISGVWTLISPVEGYRSERMLTEQQIPPPGAHGVSFTSGLYKYRRGCYLSGLLWVPYHLKEDQKTCLLKDAYFGTRAV